MRTFSYHISIVHCPAKALYDVSNICCKPIFRLKELGAVLWANATKLLRTSKIKLNKALIIRPNTTYRSSTKVCYCTL